LTKNSKFCKRDKTSHNSLLEINVKKYIILLNYNQGGKKLKNNCNLILFQLEYEP